MNRFLHKHIVIILIFSLIIVFSSICSAETSRKKIEIVKVQAVSLRNNLVRESLEQDLVIYLPASYWETQKRYPVVYFISGFTRYPIDIVSLTNYFDTAMKEAGHEFIVVGVNARNKLGGSFGVNSPVTGNWEDFIVKDVVEHVDSNYRTIAKPDSRGIAGWSMGGFVAINLGLKHPGLFSIVYGLAPGLFDENGLVEAMETWDSMFLTAYGAAFAPEPTKDFPHCSIPKFNNTKSDNQIRAKWENGFGNLKQKIEAYLKLQMPLKSIQIIYGESDSYPWIPKGCKYFVELLKENEIPHELIECPGGHDLGLVRNSFVPFFVKNLNFKDTQEGIEAETNEEAVQIEKREEELNIESEAGE